jgi:hypothetical protein
MGTTLTGTTPQDTYDSLIKVTDNGPLSGTAKYLSDGLGNDSVLALSTTALGIGTNAPVGKLTIAGTSAQPPSSGTTPNSLLQIKGSLGNQLNIGSNTVAGDYGSYIQASDNNLAANYPLNLQPNGGNVGIGTSTPAAKLDVSGAFSSVRTDIIGIEDTAHVYRGTPDGAGFEHAKVLSGRDATTFSYGSFLAFYTEGKGSGTTDTSTEKARITSQGYLRMASGTGGIQFNGDTAAANALNDYEEGTWTPVIRGAATAGTYEYASTIAASYTKIGRQVTVRAEMNLAASVTGGGTGYAQVTGLPFSNNGQAVGSVFFSGIDFSGNYIVCQFINSNGASTIYFSEVTDNSVASDFPISAIGALDTINFTLTYFV